MASWVRLLLLSGLAAATMGCSLFGRDKPPLEEAGASVPVISPEVERRPVSRPKIDTEDFEVTGFLGLISVEDFGTNTIYGARAAYHVTEDLFVEGSYGHVDAVKLTSEESLNNVDLLGNDRMYSYYNLAVGWNVLPGEVFLGKNHAFNSAFYVLAGAGNTNFADAQRFTLTFGAGYRLLATDAIALHLDVRDHLFKNDITGIDKTTNNIEFDLGVSWFF